jgi:hypothetical protein|tara:strand:+ start:3288 stop:3563 length:276 start_codon:yes stop_codon:yes gene_type:complete
MSNRAIDDGTFLTFKCPYEDCKLYIEVAKKELNCKIFRHGVLKNNNKQINPHSSKQICDNLSQQNAVYGCARPFKLIPKFDGYYPEQCAYI